MNLKELLPAFDMIVVGEDDFDVLGVSYDSRKVESGFAFFALPGHKTSGSKYIHEAINNGAIVIVTTEKQKDCPITQVVVVDILKFMAVFCAKFYNYPDKHLNVIGITGTNGKTTVSYMIESIFKQSNVDCAVMGTVNYRYKGNIVEAPNTTPQSLDIYKFMRDVVNNGIKNIVMEVSSHALSLGRVYGIEFDIAIFTNLTQDHLDFHKDMKGYFKAKSMLFESLCKSNKIAEKYAVINSDDKYGKKLASLVTNAHVKFYSTEKATNSDFKALNILVENNGTSFDLIYNELKGKVSIKHIGLHNVYNALASFGAAVCSGISFEAAINGINNAAQVPGRLERVDAEGLEFKVVVDYAHTDDALKNVLSAIKKVKPKRIITVFGCGGDRDRTKRPVMGKTAVEMSDFVFVTSDNPRTENPNNILLDIEVGIKRSYKNNYKVIVHRQEAIKEAVFMAAKGDVVLIAGKGHETYQVIGTQKIHFSDVEMARKYIDLRKEKENAQSLDAQKEFVF
ncbi:MAG: UDP-N-acetylmuramoyl-L-alanyl-D-glutamate--2,6-diaminopimelate ligase [Endomicrobium sp.]|jgi:UDP-N-acetylmuramoyl-L-alanyl-D-glutamate--2,6-diaminopimelate ligase|nr:UDP-N-acetylmuramoyl-L-alanyl-D-glutamate--2,6-diaminopimelate ligase [Endomicrobium sp.]